MKGTLWLSLLAVIVVSAVAHKNSAEEVAGILIEDVAGVFGESKLFQKESQSPVNSERRNSTSVLAGERDVVSHGKRTKPLKGMFMSIYKNYKSTYMGNETAADYKKRLRKRVNTITASEYSKDSATTELLSVHSEEETDKMVNPSEEIPLVELTADPKPDVTKFTQKQHKCTRQFHRQSTNQMERLEKLKSPTAASDHSLDHEYRYSIGPGVNMSLDMSNDIVGVRLSADNLLEIAQGHWLNDNTERGRGKKYDMISKVLPLFILPFLIQSAIVPFLVTKLKLLLMKSILVGKLAIFLLIISAIKNSNKMVQSYEVAPSYWAGEPSRRSELAVSASSGAYNGYRVEGKPAAWVN